MFITLSGADTGYVATIQIGTPPKDFTIKMDSGSADFWVGSEESCVTMNGTSNCVSLSHYSYLALSLNFL